MRRSPWSITLSLLLIFVSCSRTREVAVRGTEVEYTADGTTMKGYLATDTGREGKRPGILVVHEWWGHNEYARKRARMLAELGYTALAVDMFGNGRQATHPDDAGKLASETMQNLLVAKARFDAALAVLRAQANVDTQQLGAIGYCFGGGVVLTMARSGADLKGVVSFHGLLATTHPAQFGTVSARILICHGADDSFVPKEHVDAFKKEMADANVDYRFISYAGAVHAFTNPDADTYAKQFGIPIGYNEAADKHSWADMQQFFRDVFKR